MLPVSTVRDLGIFVDCDLVMRTHCVSHCHVLLRHAASIAQHPLPCLCISLPVAVDTTHGTAESIKNDNVISQRIIIKSLQMSEDVNNHDGKKLQLAFISVLIRSIFEY